MYGEPELIRYFPPRPGLLEALESELNRRRAVMGGHEHRMQVHRRGTRARGTIDKFRPLAMQTLQGRLVLTDIFYYRHSCSE